MAARVSTKRTGLGWLGRAGAVLALLTATVVVTAVPAYADPPTVDDYTDFATTAQPLSVFLPGDDPDGDPLSWSIVSAPAHGELTDDCSDGECTYTSVAGFAGNDSFTFKANDGTSDSNVATYSIDVSNPDAPQAYPTSADAAAGDTTTLTLSASDPNSLPLTFAIVSPPSHGSLSAIGTPSCDSGFCEATVDYTGATGYLGPDSFDFTASNGTLTSSPATMSLDVVTAPCQGTTIDNGVVELGVNCVGDLNVGNIGVHYIPTDDDATAPGCPCEGWGAADTVSHLSGFANESAGRSDNLTLVSFTHDAHSATSVVDVGTSMRVTHDYQPSTKSPDVYDVTVSVKNTSATAQHLVYRRVMDWDVEPTAFDEYVTVDKGSSSEITFTSDDGFASADPLSGPSSILATGNFTDSGPADHGALFDFDFGTLAAGATKTFQTYYGAAGTEAAAIDALNAIGAEAYSLGEPSTPDGPTLGTPNTFLFAFGAVGGSAIFAPNAVDDTLITAEDTAGSVNVLTNDTDPNGDTLSVTGKTNGAHGTVTCTGAGVCTYTPEANYHGPDSFTYTVDDGHGGTATGTVGVTVTSVNDNPVAVADTLTTAEDTPGSKNVLANDTDADGDTLSVTGKTDGAHGTVTCTAAGSCTYTPAANYNGADSFTYTVSDGHGGTATGTVNVTVTPVNDNPVAVTDTLTTAQDTAGSKNVLANDTDADGDTLSVTGKTDGAHGTVTCTAAGSCTYTPASGFNGADSFTYTVSDGHGGTATGTVNVTVTATATNHNPVAVADALSTAEDTPGSKNVLANDTDADGDTLSVTGKTDGAHGTVTCTAAGSCTYTPAANYNGTDSFTYTVSDGHGGTATGTVNVTVTPVNDNPVAVTDTLTTAEDSAGSKSVLANDTDADGDTLTASARTDGAHGTVTCAAAGTCTYTPAANYNGPDSFTYTVSDGHGGSAIGTVNVTVTPVNDNPVAVADVLSTAEDTPGSKSVLANDTDADGDPLTVTAKTDGAHGTVTCTAAGSCTYTPAANFNGTDSFTYTVADGHGGTATGAVDVTVTPVNDKPVAVDDTLTTAQDTAGTKNVLANDTDADADLLTVSGKTDGAHGTVACTAAGSCTYTPAGGFHGTDSFTYTVSDGHGGTATGTVDVSVTPTSTADFGLVKTASYSVAAGTLTAYHLAVTNLAATPGDVTLTDHLPAGFKVRDVDTQGCAIDGTHTLRCTLTVTGLTTHTVTVTGAFVTAGVVSNAATISSAGDANPGNDTGTASTTVTGKTCTIVGTFEDDRLLGTNHADVICGLSGDDRVNAKQGDDTVYGNEGNDQVTGLGGDDHLDGGSGTDTALYSTLSQSVRVDLEGHKATGQGTDTLVSIENVTGSGKADRLTGDSGRNVLSGLGGADVLSGGAGPDVLLGGPGNDTLRGGSGRDVCIQGPGHGSRSSC